MVAAALGVLVSAAARAEVLDGVQFPDKTMRVGERRYRVPQDWENTMKYFKTAYPSAQYPRHTIVNQPGVKAIHLANPDGHGGWVGLNIYEANDEVRVYVVPPDGVAAKPAKKATPASPKK
ncbi:MAG: hypothetical protein ACLQIH_00445 [Myxococcaceae bacterium]